MLYSYRISLSFTYFLIIVMNIEQCFALKWPFLALQHVTESNAKKFCFATFLFSIFMGIPSGLTAGIIQLGSGKNVCLAKEASNGPAFQVFYQIQTIFGILIIPHFVLLILTIILLVQIKGILSNTVVVRHQENPKPVLESALVLIFTSVLQLTICFPFATILATYHFLKLFFPGKLADLFLQLTYVLFVGFLPLNFWNLYIYLFRFNIFRAELYRIVIRPVIHKIVP